MISVASILLACSIPSYVFAFPLESRQSGTNASNPTETSPPTDTQVLQFALTLEHLEATYYERHLGQFTEVDFQNAGYEDWVRGRFEQINEHEHEHVQFLTKTLGRNSVAVCNYSFPITDGVKSFVSISQMLEAVGTAAYTGAAYLLRDSDYILAAASILAIEANHEAWIQSAVQKHNPWSGSFGNILNPSQAYTLASAFITYCPPSNPQLPVMSFPTLTVIGDVTPGAQATFEYNMTLLTSGRSTPSNALVNLTSTTSNSQASSTTSGTTTTRSLGTATTTTGSNTTSSSTVTSSSTPTPTSSSSPSSSTKPFLALFSGLKTTFVPLTLSNSSDSNNETVRATANIPSDLQGTVFAIVTTSQSTVMDDNTIAGPALINIFFNSSVETNQ